MKIVALYSGGLDSCLAVYIAREWLAKVYPLYIAHQLLSIKKIPEIPGMKVIDMTEDFVRIIQAPQHGYGRTLNPCIDCRILMLKKAKEYMKEIGADFIITGEVLDQRPMSQHITTLKLIEREAGLEGLVVRPLSGALLEPTIPERNGLISRSQLLNIKGRSRRKQLELARQKRLKNFLSPSGGCLLTDPGFCRRLADILRYKEILEGFDIELLKIGRHFRFDSDTKLVVGRDEDENKQIEAIAKKKGILLCVPDTGSPSALLLGDKSHIKLAAAITARYSDKKKEPEVIVHCQQKNKTIKVKVTPITDEELKKWRL